MKSLSAAVRDSRPSCPVASEQLIGGNRAAFLGSESKSVKGVLSWICMSWHCCVASATIGATRSRLFDRGDRTQGYDQGLHVSLGSASVDSSHLWYRVACMSSSSVVICGLRLVSVTLVWYSGAVSRCAVGRMGKLLHNGGSVSVKQVCCALCWKRHSFGVSTLTRLSHCMHSGVSTGLQQ